ncbi:carboxymuconolactone decarboxylase family protein [Thermobifida halotolerans]|uniref:Carboxymuconolactone decarboxylase family protein n=1 Tax=Thermobifida halotolerans TaxID=483545 RepID=A0AA97M007_9ACTN|nr:alkylhydroperoxidase [Thermobifida halotolerans]UOE21136.1 carboxymuconolactone decarboxylase family protein [Thermobifida halotolerans]
MARAVVRTALRRSLDQVRHVRVARPGAVTGLVAEVFAQMERDFGMLAPPVALHSPAPRVLAASWVMLRETLLAGGRADRAAKEAVAAAVSLGNSCPYCVEVHGATLGGLVRSPDSAAIAEGRIEEVADARLRALAEWARAGAARREAGTPLTEAQRSEFVGVAATFHYLNRMVNVFLPDSPLPRGTPGSARPGVRRLLGWLTRPGRGRDPEPGRSLALLPAAPPAAEPSWARAAPHVAGAVARASAAVDAAGERSVPPAVRALLARRLADWDGRPPGLSRAWVEEAVAGLAADERPAGRLALLTALASYQVDQGVVDAFRARGPGDRELVELTSWASLAAALRVVGE